MRRALFSRANGVSESVSEAFRLIGQSLAFRSVLLRVLSRRDTRTFSLYAPRMAEQLIKMDAEIYQLEAKLESVAIDQKAELIRRIGELKKEREVYLSEAETLARRKLS
jgi:hypothetical protein